MGQKLVIVESPAKAKTIGKYLGKNYIVEASMGHVRDLPKSQLGVDIDNNYNPKYITIRGKGKLLNKLRKEANKSDKIYLATDPDREGEAISWHLSHVLKLDENEKCRIEFNEITKSAVKGSIKNARQINLNLVNAQQARRVLDRLVGYKISPILWKKVKWGLSAGRVQSVALKMICEREKQIKNFVPEEYWTVECVLNKEKGSSRKAFNVKLTTFKKKKINIKSKEEVDNIIECLKSGEFLVKNVKNATKSKNPLPPFTTSTLQQDAYRKLNFSTKRTMSVAQQLYEGIDIKKHGTVGLITYMRTDSVRISEEAQEDCRNFVLDSFGNKYIPKSPRKFKSKKNIQDAHEAIRPTNVNITPDSIKQDLKPEQYKLYNLIWKRFVASQMASSIIDIKSVDIVNGDYGLKASGSKVNFDGFMKVYDYSTDGKKKNDSLPELAAGEKLVEKSIEGKQHFTQPPARYSEASLVKTLEENGIGRPSTYAPIISTLLDRKYIERDKKTLLPTELGDIVNNIVSEYFRQVVDVEFTAEMEDKLDRIEEGKEDWRKVVEEFFEPMKKAIDIAEKEVAKITIEDKVTDIKCDKCGRFMVIKHGRFGDFLACPGYPECKNTKPIVKELDVKCPKCGGKVVEKRSRKGRKFFGCSNYPECDFVSWFEPTDEKCPSCGSYMVKKYSKSKGNYLECSNSECKHREYKSKDIDTIEKENSK
ncbi:type I DNA topoisomerase [Clostridium sp. cel8]|jgi:DNA topoisomerase I|uniref:type I DNA topoisomerase n=1 Tax=unclassified Clostridium TaxID=2614128 RepID=UPI0015F57AD1|nr:type I DNA topoisomerase [Clostridium sp. cel8]MBA5850478.1 type I DNA topoisomerase [Clostridium sp. cel8]